MLKNTVILFLFSLLLFRASAQQKTKEILGDNTWLLSAGAGWGQNYFNKFLKNPSVYAVKVGAERITLEEEEFRISYGFSMSYGWQSADVINVPKTGSAHYYVQQYCPMARILWRKNFNSKKIDVYSGLSAGVRIIDVRRSYKGTFTDYDDYFYPPKTISVFGFIVGMNYIINHKTFWHIEGGFDFAYISTGLTFRLTP